MSRKSDKAKHEKSNSRGAKKFSSAIAASKQNGTAPGHHLVERKRYTTELDVTAKPEEVAAMAGTLADLEIERESIKAEKCDALAGFRDTLEGIDGRIAELAAAVKGHTKKEQVECVEYLDEATGGIRVVRQDTKEEIEYRPAEKEDLQESMFPPGKSAKADEYLDDEDDDGEGDEAAAAP